jgi:hypothetical protein
MPLDGTLQSDLLIPSRPHDDSLTKRSLSTKEAEERAKRIRDCVKGAAVRWRFRFLRRQTVTARQLLSFARALIEDKDDWTQGILANHDGQLCSVGALLVAIYRLKLIPTDQVVTDAICSLGQQVLCCPKAMSRDKILERIEAFNDAANHAVVLDMFRSAERRLAKDFSD